MIKVETSFDDSIFTCPDELITLSPFSHTKSTGKLPSSNTQVRDAFFPVFKTILDCTVFIFGRSDSERKHFKRLESNRECAYHLKLSDESGTRLK